MVERSPQAGSDGGATPLRPVERPSDAPSSLNALRRRLVELARSAAPQIALGGA